MNLKHTRLIELILDGRSNEEAFRDVYNCPDRTKESVYASVSRILAREDVKEYIEERKKNIVQEMDVDLDTARLIREGLAALEIAKNNEKPNEVVKCLEFLAKIADLFPKEEKGKVEVINNIGIKAIDVEEDLREIGLRLLEEGKNNE